MLVDKEAFPDREKSWALAVELFGRPGARDWMRRRQPGIGEHRPIDVWRREDGARQVRELLERIADGGIA